VAVAGLRSPGLRTVVVDDATVALRLQVDRRDELGRARTEVVSRIHHLLLELIPGGAKKFLTRGQASHLLRTAPAPVGIVAQTRHQLAGELIEDLTVIDAKIRAANRQLRQLVAATGSSLGELNGIGPSGAARLLGDIGDISRFGTAGHFASWNGTAPIEASSGDQQRHRLSRAGNRRINRVLHIMAIVQLRHDTQAAPTTDDAWPKARPRWKPYAPSNATCPMWSTVRWSSTPDALGPVGRVREDTWERLYNPARPAQSRRLALRTGHSPDPPPASVEQSSPQPLDQEGSQMRSGLSVIRRPLGERDEVARLVDREPVPATFVMVAHELAHPGVGILGQGPGLGRVQFVGLLDQEAMFGSSLVERFPHLLRRSPRSSPRWCRRDWTSHQVT
jgi:hypothetical protein